MTLHAVKQGVNPFCGPAVISTITGMDTDEAAGLIQKARSSTRRVTGVYTHELITVLESLGYRCHHLSGVAGYSIFTLMLTRRFVPGIYLFITNGHFITIEIDPDGKRYISDNHSRKPVNISASARLTNKVFGVVKVERNA